VWRQLVPCEVGHPWRRPLASLHSIPAEGALLRREPPCPLSRPGAQGLPRRHAVPRLLLQRSAREGWTSAGAGRAVGSAQRRRAKEEGRASRTPLAFVAQARPRVSGLPTGFIATPL